MTQKEVDTNQYIFELLKMNQTLNKELQDIVAVYKEVKQNEALVLYNFLSK